MTITEDRLRQTFSERLRVGASAGMGGAQEIYQEVKAASDFLSRGFRRGFPPCVSETDMDYNSFFSAATTSFLKSPISLK